MMNSQDDGGQTTDGDVPDLLSFDDPAHNLFALATILSDQISRTFKIHLEAYHNLSLPEWRVLNTLSHFPNLTAADITHRWGLDKMTVNRAISKLEERGHINRSRHPSDLRSFQLSLTAQGAREVEAVLPRANARYRDYTACLDRTEGEALRIILVKLIDHVVTLQSKPLPDNDKPA